MRQDRPLTRAVTVLTVILCAALCAAVLLVYFGGVWQRTLTGSSSAPIFTLEAIKTHGMGVLPVFAVWLALAAAAAYAEKAPGPLRAAQPMERSLALLHARIGELPPEAHREQALRRRIMWICGAAGALCGGWALAWLLDPGHFVSWELEEVMGRMLLHVMPPAAVGFGALCAAARLCDDSRAREAQALRQAVRVQRLPRAAAPLKGQEETGGRRLLRGALILAAAALLLLGVLNGGLNDVWVKAINICTECIGLG